MIEGPISQSISSFLARAVYTRGPKPALGCIRGGQLQWCSWEEIAHDAVSLAEEIRNAGIDSGDRVAHVSGNCYEWIITDLALHLTDAVHVPIHITLSGEQIADQIRDCGAKLLFVSSGEQLARFATKIDSRIAVRIYGQPVRTTTTHLSQAFPDPLTRNQTSPATILYTSGTTGRPRGVMLSHHNLASNAAAVCEAHQVHSDHTMLCILPLSHIYARTCDLYTWIVSGSRLVLAESRDTLLRDCQLVQPTALNAVPFVYQRVMEGVRNAQVVDQSAALLAAFGNRIEMLFCGGAPVAPDVAAWYADHGLPLLPGYGLTEASPVITVTTRGARRLGTVGQAIPGIELRIAADGELLTRGLNVMLGYWHDEAATADVIHDGWLRTGDLAELDADGFLSIRGRKKELIVLSTGKKVTPTRVESLLTASPLIEQVAVFGDGQCGLTALIVPSNINSRSTACGLAQYQAEINRRLATAAHEEQVHHFVIVDRPFSIKRGELTAKMSLCRNAIARNFATELGSMNNEPRRYDDHNVLLESQETQ